MNHDRLLVPFDKEAVKAHLDKCIRYWRTQVGIDPDFAFYYIDAYQSMRLALFGDRLPIDIIEEVQYQTSTL